MHKIFRPPVTRPKKPIVIKPVQSPVKTRTNDVKTTNAKAPYVLLQGNITKLTAMVFAIFLTNV